jgi:hypothetical protein
VAALQRGYASGALQTETFADRVVRALSARTSHELRGLTADLEAPSPWRRPFRMWRRLPPSLALPDATGLAGARIELGRSPRCQLVFADGSVSRHHATLLVRERTWFIRDVGSLNGTWVNGRRVREAEVRSGDEVQLGQIAFRL